MESIVNSFNLYVDSDNPLNNGSTGDNFVLYLGANSIQCDAGEYIRMTLNNFSMSRGFTDVNGTNDTFYLYVDGDENARFQEGIPLANFTFVEEQTINGVTYRFGIWEIPLRLTNRNNTSALKLAEDFAAQINGAMSYAKATAGALLALESTNVEPNSYTSIQASTTWAGDATGIISFEIKTSSSNSATDVPLVRQMSVVFYEQDGDIYKLLGGNRQTQTRIANPTTLPTSSIHIELETDMNSKLMGVKCQCLYPSQRASLNHLYLRTDLVSTGIETHSLSSTFRNRSHNDAITSSILARIPINDIMLGSAINYDSQVGQEFFIHCKQKVINTIRFRLTDNHDQALTTLGGGKTATGARDVSYQLLPLAANQSTLGNMSFTCVIRVDIVRDTTPELLKTKPYQNPVPARFSNLLIHQDHGGQTV